MRAASIIGILLIVLGGLGLAYKGFEYTRSEEVLDVGPIEASVDRTERVDIPVWLSGIVLVAGVGLLLAGRKT